MSRVTSRGVVVCLLYASMAAAGQSATLGGQPLDTTTVATPRTDGLPAGYLGPPPPIAPEVITRDAAGKHATIRAVRLTTPLKIDGQLTEEVYETVQPISDFIQQEPQEGTPATEKTDVWIFFDNENFYLVARCWDSHPDREIATEMRRDGARVPRNENLAFGLDSLFDHRNGYDFELTPVGGVFDLQITNDGATTDSSWNGVWEHGTSRFEHGWVAEVRIPFKTLRYQPGAEQVWALQVRRMVRWKNELSFITSMPASIGERAHMRLSLAPAIVGLEVPPPGKNLNIKPWVTSSLSTDRTVTPRVANHGASTWGGDIKYGVTNSLTADFTYNTDFAQVEADTQQVNLTSFNLNIPEKRDFFLENSGTFLFAGASGTDNTPALFYSRRIGLSGNQAVPIVAGERLSGRVGKYTVGLLNIESDSVDGSNIPSTNFSVVRVKRDILRRSYIGGLFTGRSVAQAGSGRNDAYGVDAGFNLKTNLTINTYFAQTHSPGLSGKDTSYKANFDYEGDRYGALVEYLAVNPNFNPEVGFVRRLDMRRTYGQFRFSPRPTNRRSFIRKYYYNGTAEYITNTTGRVENKTYTGEFAIDFQNSDHANIKYSDFFEFLPRPVSLASDMIEPVGGYSYRSVLAGYNFGAQRPWFSTNTSLEYGTFRDGHKTSVIVTSGATSWGAHFMVEPSYTLNYITVPQGTVNQNLVGPRITYGVTPQAFISALVQYNTTTNTLSTNLRLRWEYHPGSELFFVLNEQRNTFTGGLPLQNRSVVVKFNHLFGF